ncbi:MAG: DUF2911 domain-containing protein [Terriglobales bacterium]
MRLLTSCLLGLLAFSGPLVAQHNAQPQSVTAECNFDDGKQVSIEYNPGKGEDFHNGKVWEPGGSPMILFTSAPLVVGSSTIEPGAYSVYTIPDKKDWTLIINKNVKPGSKYDASQDLAHASMETGEIDQAEKELQVSFAHMAPKDCSIRMYMGKVGAFTDLKEP